MDNSPTTIGVGKRWTILNSIGNDGSDGQSLRGQNVNDFPANALFYVRDSGRLYRLKKDMAIAIVQDASGMANVINGLGSSAAAGRFVAIRQMGIGTLVAGEGSASVVIAGFDVNPDGWFHVTHTSFGGTTGFLRAFASSETEVTVDSTAADSGGVFVTYYQSPGDE